MSPRLYRLYLLHSRLKKRIYRRVGYNGRLFLLFTALSLLFGADTRSTMIYQLAALLAVLVFVSFCFSFFFPPEIEVRRLLPKTCTAGEPLYYHLELKNSGRNISSGLFFSEESGADYPGFEEFAACPEAGEKDRNFVDRKFGYYRWVWLLAQRAGASFESFPLPPLATGETGLAKVRLLPRRRGYIRLAGYTVHRLDPLGLFKNEIFSERPAQLLVLPQLYPVEQGDLAGTRKYHQGGVTTAAGTGETGEFVSLRDYRNGDPVKNIDWKVTARVGSAVVRQYQDEYFSRNGIVLDTFTDQEDQVFEDAVSVAASVVARQDSARNLIDLLFACDNCVSSVSMGPGQADKQHILEILACIAPCRDGDFSSLSELVMAHTNLLSGLVLVFLTFDETRNKFIHYLQERRIPHKTILVTGDMEKSKKLLAKYSAPHIRLFDVESAAKVVNLS